MSNRKRTVSLAEKRAEAEADTGDWWRVMAFVAGHKVQSWITEQPKEVAGRFRWMFGADVQIEIQRA